MAACDCYLENSYPRISGRTGNLIDLNVDFYNNGKLDDPFWIQRVEIYRCTVSPENLEAVIPFASCDDPLYPAPACQETLPVDIGQCGTAPPPNGEPIPGKYHLPFLIPSDFKAPEVYIDVWYFYPRNPCIGDQYPAECPPVNTVISGTNPPCDCTDPQYEDQLVTCCHRFWVYPDSWLCNDGLQTINFGFESLNVRFNSPEVKPLEVGLIPLPVYSYNKNLVDPLIPFLKASITIGTQYCDVLVQDAEMDLGFRQGNYRTNPWVVKWNLDTGTFIRGTYWYQIKLTLPDGTTRVSKKFWFEIR